LILSINNNDKIKVITEYHVNQMINNADNSRMVECNLNEFEKHDLEKKNVTEITPEIT
jgi:hypothetical protein